MTIPASSRASHSGSKNGCTHAGPSKLGLTGSDTAANPRSLVRCTSATASSISRSGMAAVHTKRGEERCMSRAQSFSTRAPSLASFGSRMLNDQIPREGKVSSAQIPSSSRSSSRPLMSRPVPASPPCGALRCFSSVSSLDVPASVSGRGIRRRKVCPSTVTVSHMPSGSFTLCGMRSARSFGRLASNRSAGSTKCESPEFAQSLSPMALLWFSRLDSGCAAP